MTVNERYTAEQRRPEDTNTPHWYDRKGQQNVLFPQKEAHTLEGRSKHVQAGQKKLNR